MCFAPFDLRVSLNFVHIYEQHLKAKFLAISCSMIAIIVQNGKESFQWNFL